MGDFSESIRLEAENQRLKALVEQMNNAERKQVQREAFIAGFEAGQKRNARIASLEAEKAVLKNQLEALKAKHKEELRAAKYAAWNAACDEIRASALVVGTKDHKYILDAMGEFE